MNHVIQNYDELAGESELRKDALDIAEAGYTAIDTGVALRKRVRIEGDTLFIDDSTHSIAGRRIFFVGIGKCAFVASRAIEEIFGDRLTGGIALDASSREQDEVKRIETFVGTHPLPSEANTDATRKIVDLLSACTKEDLVIALVSGGGSTLICLNETPMTCLDESALFTELTAKGATIQELNTVRKHTSLARGGGLAKAAYPAEVISLIVSDVPGNNIEYISSGPTVRDDSTVADAQAILTHYDIVPSATTTFIETPKEEKYFEHVQNVLFLTNQNALHAMKEEAERRGYAATLCSDTVAGEAGDVGRSTAEKLHTAPSKSVLLFAGETTVTLGDTHGIGGRNQEVALAALTHIHDDELVLPFSSDGHDNTDHAGAIADAITRSHAIEKNLSAEHALTAHESYLFFKTSGDALQTGYTGSNVSDIIIAIKN